MDTLPERKGERNSLVSFSAERASLFFWLCRTVPEFSPGTDLLGLPLVSCLWKVGKIGRKQEQDGPTPLGVTELRVPDPNPLSPLKRVRMAERGNAFVCGYNFVLALRAVSLLSPASSRISN